MRRTTYLLAIISVGLLIYAHGIAQKPATVQLLFNAIDAILSIFVVIYLLRILYTFERKKFLRRTWFEGLLMAIIFINEVSTYGLQESVIYTIFERIDIPLSVELYRWWCRSLCCCC